MSGGVALLDYDGDGWLDIYFTNARCVSMALAGKKPGALSTEQSRRHLYRCNGEGRSRLPLLGDGRRSGDYNNDGRPDIVVSCFGGVVLYRKQRDGTFTDVTKASGLDKDTGWQQASPSETTTAMADPICSSPLRRLRSEGSTHIRFAQNLPVSRDRVQCDLATQGYPIRCTTTMGTARYR